MAILSQMHIIDYIEIDPKNLIRNEDNPFYKPRHWRASQDLPIIIRRKSRKHSGAVSSILA